MKRARTSFYRRWPSKRHLVAHAVVAELGVKPAPDTGSLRKDLRAAVGTLLTAFAEPCEKRFRGSSRIWRSIPRSRERFGRRCW